MKTIAFLLLASIPFVGMSQSSDYKIASFLTEGTKAPNTHYIGEAWLNSVLQADDDINYNITKATFRANSTLDWHKHPTPQVLIIVEGEGYYQERGKEPIILKKGDVIKCNKELSYISGYLWWNSTNHLDRKTHPGIL
jgi:quercetin dioxygenase-like cupin family protein